MANYFVDSTTGSDGDNGTTMDLAWATIDHAVTAGSLVGGDVVFVRRIHTETPAALFTMTYDGQAKSPITVTGWPRAADTSITGGTWTNGNTTVDLITGLSMVRSQHLGRFLTGPDGNDYLITKVVDTNTVLIDREYAGATVTLTNGAATVKADEEWYDDMGTEYGFDDSEWAIKETDWDADSDALALVDLSGTAAYWYNNSVAFAKVQNFEFINGSTYAMRWTGGKTSILRGIITSTEAGQVTWYIQNGNYTLDRIISTGNGIGGAQAAFYLNYVQALVKNCAGYDLGDTALQCIYSFVEVENLNLGVEGTCGDADLQVNTMGRVWGRDVKFGANIQEVEQYVGQYGFARCSIENHNKIFGTHKTWTSKGTLTKTPVVVGSGDPERRAAGASSVIEVYYNLNNGLTSDTEAVEDLNPSPIFTHEFNVNTTSKSYRYYVQAEGAVTADQLWLVCEYVDVYDGTTTYSYAKVKSDEAIAQRTGADDWSQYLEVVGIQPAANCILRIKCYCNYYHAANNIYIDPLVVIS